jgi:hypothetical protein
MTEDSVAKRLSNIEKTLKRIEKSQDNQKESTETQADLKLQVLSAELQQSIGELQQATAKSQITHEDISIDHYKMALDQYEFILLEAKDNVFNTLFAMGMGTTSIGFAILAIGIMKDHASWELAGFIIVLFGAYITPLFYLSFYIKKIISRKKARKRDANK